MKTPETKADKTPDMIEVAAADTLVFVVLGVAVVVGLVVAGISSMLAYF
jgi:hypothetical protein